MWFFNSTEKKAQDEKKWNNDEKPSHESVLWRFRTLKNIREGNVPCLRKVKFEKKLEIIPVSYKRGSIELAEDRCRSPSLCFSDNENLRPHSSEGQKNEKRKKRKRKNRKR